MAASADGKGRFPKGNKAAKGGARANAGRPPDSVKKAAKELAEGRVEASLAVIDRCLDLRPPPGNFPDPEDDSAPEGPEPPTWKDRLKAAELMLAYAWHKPTQPTRHSGEVAYTKNYGPDAPTEVV